MRNPRNNADIDRSIEFWWRVEIAFLGLAGLGLGTCIVGFFLVVVTPSLDGRVAAVTELAIALGLFAFAGVQVARDYGKKWSEHVRFI
jgi:hypothetical protein